MTLLRFLLVQSLLLWQGGFLFYASVVVPAGTVLLGKAGQGAITARVTDALNVLGLVGVALFALELSLTRDPDRRRLRPDRRPSRKGSGRAASANVQEGRTAGRVHRPGDRFDMGRQRPRVRRPARQMVARLAAGRSGQVVRLVRRTPDDLDFRA